MAAIENEKIYGLKIRESANDGSDFGTPDADYRFAFVGEDGMWHTKDASNVVRYPPGAELDYAQITSGVTVASTTPGTGTAIVSGASTSFDGGAVVIEFFSPSVNTGGGTNGFVGIEVYEDGTVVGTIAVVLNALSTAAIRAPVLARLRRTPSAGSHTYSIKAFRDTTGSGTATVSAGALGSNVLAPAFIRVTKV